MKRLCVFVVATWLAVGAGSAQAQFWNPFRKSPPPLPPAERVSQMVSVIKSDPDERKRTQAAEGLREFDAKTFPEVVSVLADVAQNDPKPGVRAEAVNSLVRIRPVTPLAGQAIEHAAAKEEHWRNKMNAQAALVRYRIAGYSSTMPAPDAKQPPTGTASNPQSKEPPIGDRPPIIYYDQHGKVIPAPKNLPGPIVPVPGPMPNVGIPKPVGAVPVSGSKTQPPFNTIGPSTPGGYPQVVPTPTPAYPPPQPTPPAPVSIEPTFRNVNKLPANSPVTIGTPTGLTPPPAAGPSLDLPPLPINGVPAPAPAPAPPAQGPSLESSTSGSSPLPTGRMEPTPRLEPAP